MGESEQILRFLIGRREQIEAVMNERLGPAAPGPGAGESEALRRFRAFTAAALRRGEEAQPSVDGLRANERRVAALLQAWVDAASDVAGDGRDAVRRALSPLAVRFANSLKRSSIGRRAKGAPRSNRRAVSAAIDRIADPFLAVDSGSGRIVDANPAAGALLGVARDALLGVEAMAFVPDEAREAWWNELDAVSEGSEPRRFQARLKDVGGDPIPVDCSVTAFATRDRSLALVVARPG